MTTTFGANYFSSFTNLFFYMKPYTHRLLSFLLLSIFALSSIPAFAVTATPAASNAGTTWQTTTTTTGHVVKQKSEKRGFFAKIKNFGKKTKLFFRAMGAVAGDHNVIVAVLLAFFLGGLAIHRVYLGGRPLLILLYLITFGGIFGILPLIDFIRLIIGQMEHYEDNDAFFAAFQSAK